MVTGKKIQNFCDWSWKVNDCSAAHRLDLTSAFVYQSISCMFLFGLGMMGMSYAHALKTLLRCSFRSGNLTGFMDKSQN